MRRAAFLALIALVLSGCASDPQADGPTESEEFEEELGVQSTETKGVLLGVVVDDTITPLAAAKVSLTRSDGGLDNKTTDDEGRFAFGDLEPGTYLVQVALLQYTTVSANFEVVANEADPKVHRIQLARLFDQAPYTELITYEGFIACAYSFSLSSTCVNDYTRVTGEQCAPGVGCYCAGGCFRDQELAKQGGNRREYVSAVGPGWQSIIFEATWEATSDVGTGLGITVSYFSRPDAGHWFGTVRGEDPIRLQLDLGVEHESAQYADGQPTIIDANGTEELFVFFGAGDGSLSVNQGFRAYQTVYYYAIPEEGWSFVAGDPKPF